MGKQFFSDYFDTMTFIFTTIVFIASLLHVFNLISVGDMSNFVLITAVLTFVLSLIPYLMSQLTFKSWYMFHILNATVQLIGLFSLGIFLRGGLPTLGSALISMVIFFSLYLLSMAKKIHELKQLADMMNERL
ncbi:hypothetical protein [Marinilactibacillus kalidii]|uniref:hypothetical protein n=1 Tax=Marinilactibacillus kalidii TaxID=2820274 RepID=UPI001ABE5D52|nr:hypothetical protein [Marinilactibacillus kalidii]